MDCYNHPGKESTKVCDICGKPVCDECAVELAGKTYCKSCLENIVSINANNEENAPNEMDSAYIQEDPQPVSFKSELPDRDNIINDISKSDDGIEYNPYNVKPQTEYYNEELEFDTQEPYFDDVKQPNTQEIKEQYFDEIKQPTLNRQEQNFDEIKPDFGTQDEYINEREQPTNLFQENSFEDDFIYPDHSYEPPEIQSYTNESSYDSYLDDLYFDDNEIPLREQLAKDEENFGSITKTPYQPREEINRYESQERMRNDGYLDIDDIGYNTPQEDYIPPKQRYTAYENDAYSNPSHIRQYANDYGMKPSTRPIHNIRKENEKEPVGTVDIILTIILIILIIIVLFYIVYVFMLSSYYPTFMDAIYGLSDPGTLFGHLMGN